MMDWQYRILLAVCSYLLVFGSAQTLVEQVQLAKPAAKSTCSFSGQISSWFGELDGVILGWISTCTCGTVTARKGLEGHYPLHWPRLSAWIHCLRRSLLNKASASALSQFWNDVFLRDCWLDFVIGVKGSFSCYFRYFPLCGVRI